MASPRRMLLQLAGGSLAARILPTPAWAADYPVRPIRLITPFAAGTSADIVARLIGQWLTDRLGQPVIIDNKPGAGSSIGTETAVRSAPDGYTLVLVTTAHAINATFYDNLPFRFVRDIAPVSGVVDVPNILEVHPSVPASKVPELIVYAKAHPGVLNYATNGLGTSSHLAGELFKMLTGINMVPVPYRGAPEALADMISGRVQVMFDLLPTSIGHVKSGTLRALAVTTSKRTMALPDIPTISEYVTGYDASTWMGIGAPSGTPADIVDLLNSTINACFHDMAMLKRFSNIGATGLPGNAAEFGKFMNSETEKWASVVKFSGAKAE